MSEYVGPKQRRGLSIDSGIAEIAKSAAMNDQWRDLRIDLPNGYDADNRRATALLAERDALAKRVDALHKALRDHTILTSEYRDENGDVHIAFFECRRCCVRWNDGNAESHAPDCLARPSTPPTDGAA